MWRRAPPACASCAIRRTGATVTPSPTAPTAGRGTQSSKTFPTTGRTRPWRSSACAPRARLSTRTPRTGASIRSRMRVRRVARRFRRLARGEILAIKGLGGFHLACDARNREAIERLRGRKRRSEKPFALMCRDAEAAARLCAMSAAERRTLESPERPILILRRRPECQIPGEVAPGNRTLGIMLPCTPLHHLLFQDAPFDTLVMTSGNRSEEPIVTRNEEARERLSGVAGWFLTHDRDIFMRTDDSVVRHIAGTPRVLRRSRGYAPRTIELGRELPELLAVGGELKNAFCLTKGRHAILSQHIGDLENYETLAFFEETLAN